MQTALTSRAVIDQAIRIVRSRSGGSANEAFDRLRRINQSENVKLSVIARRLVDEGSTPCPRSQRQLRPVRLATSG